MSKDSKRPVRDAGLPKPMVPYRAGGKDQGDRATRKNALADTGTIGYVPGDDSDIRGSSLYAGGVHESRRKSGPPAAYGVPEPDDDDRRPMPRDQPVSSQPTHVGNIVRFLDGHSELHRERPALVRYLNDPETPDHAKQSVRDEITFRDALHNHRYW
jgi:hypothetical protein